MIVVYGFPLETYLTLKCTICIKPNQLYERQFV